MPVTYRITIEYTTTKPTMFGPEHWDWPDLLDLNPTHEAFGLLSVDEIETNDDHVDSIKIATCLES